jgi:hypothetical protein
LSQKTLQPFLFKDYENIFANEPLYYTTFPSQWWDVIEKDILNYQLPFKPKTIAKRLSSLFPEIVFVQEGNFGKNQPWIVATSPVPSKAIVTICMSFLLGRNYISNKSNLSYEISLDWKKVNFDELSVNEYQLIPALIAKKFVQAYSNSFFRYKLTGTDLPFFNVFNGNGYEIVSAPYSLDNNKDKFSYVLKVDLITRGLENKKLLKITPGSRRYYQREAKKPVFDVRYGESGSLYVSQNHVFGVTKNQAYSKFLFERKNGVLQLKGYEKSVLHDLFPSIPDVEHIFKESKRFLNEGSFLIGYSNRLFEKGTIVKQGISVQERNTLIQLIEDVFPSISKISKLEEVRVASKPIKSDYRFLNTSGNLEVKLGMFVPEYTKESAINEWETKGYIVKRNGDIYINSIPETRLTIFQYGSELIREIPVLEGEALETAKKRYRNDFSSYISDKKNIDGAFIEIEPFHMIDGTKEKDPKQIIREVFRKKKIVSQFIHPEEDKGSYNSRLNNAFLDLLTDIGFSDPNLEESLFTKRVIANFSIIRKNSREFLPVLSKIESGELLFKTPFSNRWMRINDYLTTSYVADCFYKNNQGIPLKKWLESELIGLLLDVNQKKDIILMVDTTVRNGWFSEFKNENIRLMENPFSNFSIDEWNRLKVIRYNLTKDVPNYYISKNKDDDGNNHATGLFRDNQGIYYAVGSKAPAMRKINKNATRLETNQILFAKQQSIEIIPLTFVDETEQNELAYIVHKLRSLALTYDASLRFPINAHLSMGLRKYFPNESYDNGEADDFDETIIIDESGQLGFEF